MESVRGRGDCSGVVHQSPILTPNWAAQEALAHEVGISSNYLSDVERGRRNITVKLLFTLAAGLSALPDDLFATLLEGASEG